MTDTAPAPPAVARLDVVALDTPDPRRLAEFYSALTGAPVVKTDDDWIELRAEHGVGLAFQLAPDHRPPQWPSAEHPQQLHLDFAVPDLDEGEAAVVALGGRKADVQPGETFRVFLDPAGHPFCLVLAE